jgi:pimeloyl-ACP methyl ester carboxylesterase
VHTITTADGQTGKEHRRAIQGLAVALLALSICLASVRALSAERPQAAAAGPTVRNVLLVHGAFADGSSWAKVIPLLEARGLHVIAVQNPLSSLADDVAATKRAIARHIHATTTTLPTGHVPMSSKPDQVAAVTIDAASKAGQR